LALSTENRRYAGAVRGWAGVGVVKIARELGAGQNVIRSYAPGRVTVNEQTYATSILVTPEHIVSDWRPRDFSQLQRADFEAIAALNPEVVLLGTGARLQFPSPVLTRALMVARIGLEVMDTGAACRTYNVLMAEGRRVVAALLPIE
jgi:uncharacterized protein